MTTLDDICAYADRKLKGSTLTFALVVWVKGQADNPKSVALSSPPESQADATMALRTTADAQDAAWKPSS
jgi:hypothetical protein